MISSSRSSCLIRQSTTQPLIPTAVASNGGGLAHRRCLALRSNRLSAQARVLAVLRAGDNLGAW